MRLLAVLCFATAAAIVYFAYRSITSEDRVDDGCPTVNWEGRFSMTVPTLLRPEHIHDVVDAIAEARRRGSNLTVIGSGHSWSDIAVPSEVAVCMRLYKGLVTVDAEQRRATFRSGTTLHDILIALDKYGWTLDNLPSIKEQTIAGLIATGTHGSGLTYQNLASMVVSLQLVAGTGQVLTVSHTENAELFHAVTIGLGMFGIITEVTIQAVPAYNLHEKTEVLPLDYVVENLNLIAASSDHVKLWAELHSEKVAVFRQKKTAESPRNNAVSAWKEFEIHIYEVFVFFFAYFKPLAPSGMRFLSHYCGILPEVERVDVAANVLNIRHHIPVHPEAEVAVPMENATAAVRILQDVAREMNLAINFITEIRFVRGDSFWLSPDFGHDTCHLTLMMYRQENVVHDYFSTIERRLLLLGGRPHWGKLSYLTETQLRPLYDKWDGFFVLKSRLDPDKVFCNKYLARMFPSTC